MQWTRKMIGAATASALVLTAAPTATFASEESAAAPMPLTATTFNLEGEAAWIDTLDAAGERQVLVLDLSGLPAEQREALGLGVGDTREPMRAQPTDEVAEGMADDPTGFVETQRPQDDPFQADTAGLGAPFGENNVVETQSSNTTSSAGTFGQPGGASVTADGHASDSSNNTHGDIAEGLQNQSNNEDDTANGGSQPNSPDS